MKNKFYIIISSFIITLLVSSCGGSDSSDNVTPTPTSVIPPESSTLIFPERNKECTEGQVISETQSEVTFEWNASQNTDSYELNLINLSLNSTQKVPSTTTTVSATLIRGVPYEWFVISKADGTDVTAESERWRFYNAGQGIQNYAPFPAEAINPQRGASLELAGTISLEWSTEDVDNDIVSYEVLFGVETEPSNSLGTTSEKSVEVAVSSGVVYYWRVLTTDSNSNTSSSEVFHFRVD